MPKRVIISQDYDGCYSIVAPGGLQAELNGPNRKFYQNPAYASFTEKLKQIPGQYRDYLTSITKDAAAVSVYVGSDRQSYDLDMLNVTNNRNGSVFPALRTLCTQRTTADCPWTFERFLLADGKNPRGTALKIMDSGGARHLEAPPPTQKTEGGKPSKIPMLIKQMQDAARQYPNEELEFHFIDDRQDLIDDICKYLSPQNIPAGMTLKVSKFDYVGVLQNEPGALGHVKSITSSRPFALKEKVRVVPEPIVISKPVEQHPPEAISATKIDQTALKDTIKNYLTYLQNKIHDNHVILVQHNGVFTAPEGSSPIINKLVIRYNAMATLNSAIEHKAVLDEVDIDAAKHAVRGCIDNRPTWSERPFLQKLTDCLSLGLKPLYRAFFSKESELQEEIEHIVHPNERLSG